MSWGATREPINPYYVAACERVEALAKEASGKWRRITTCAACGCVFLPKVPGVTDCYGCYQRELKRAEDEVDRQLYAAYLEREGPFIHRWNARIPAPAPEIAPAREGDVQQSLFEESA